jgi:hypothetical protein
MKECKLIKYSCPYGKKVALVDCRVICDHYKGSTDKSIKCSYEYDMQETSEIKTGKVTSSDCKQVPNVGKKVKKYKLKMSEKKLNKIQLRICLDCANKEVLDKKPSDNQYCKVCDCNLSRYFVKKEKHNANYKG